MMQSDRDRFLSQPIPREITHNPVLTRPTRIRIVKAFMIRGTRVEVGSIHEIPFADARDAVALKRAEYVE